MSCVEYDKFPQFASFTIGTMYWDVTYSFHNYSKTQAAVFSKESGEVLYEEDRIPSFLGTVPKKSPFPMAAKLMLEGELTVTGFGCDAGGKNIGNKEVQLLESCLCRKDEFGLVPGRFYTSLKNQDFDEFYEHSKNLFDDDIIKYIELLISFPVELVSDKYYSSFEDDDFAEKHKYLMERNHGVFCLDNLISIAEEICEINQDEKRVDEFYKTEKERKRFKRNFGRIQDLMDLGHIVQTYKRRNKYIPSGKLMHIAYLHPDIHDFDIVLFLLESWMASKRFPSSPPEWNVVDSIKNSDGENFFLHKLLYNKEKKTMKLLKGSKSKRAKTLYKQLKTLGEEEINRKSLGTLENFHNGVFGWRKRLCSKS